MICRRVFERAQWNVDRYSLHTNYIFTFFAYMLILASTTASWRGQYYRIVLGMSFFLSDDTR